MYVRLGWLGVKGVIIFKWVVLGGGGAGFIFGYWWGGGCRVRLNM